MTSYFDDTRSPSNFITVVVFLLYSFATLPMFHVNIITGSGFDQKSGNWNYSHLKFLQYLEEELVTPYFAWMSLIKVT